MRQFMFRNHKLVNILCSLLSWHIIGLPVLQLAFNLNNNWNKSTKTEDYSVMCYYQWLWGKAQNAGSSSNTSSSIRVRIDQGNAVSVTNSIHNLQNAQKMFQRSPPLCDHKSTVFLYIISEEGLITDISHQPGIIHHKEI